MVDFVFEGFDELEAEGYISEMHTITRHASRESVISPTFNLESCRRCGFPRGTKVVFTGQGGYEGERLRAAELLGERCLTVKYCRVDSWSSSYEFEEVAGTWNSVMFEEATDLRDHNEGLPGMSEYTYEDFSRDCDRW